MKTKEEIEQLAEEAYPNHVGLDGIHIQRLAFKVGYYQCQEDMAEKTHTCYHPLPYRLAKSDVNYECTLCGKFI
jgi:hypothetical protein